MERKILEKVKGKRTTDGDNVSLVRVLGHTTTKVFDPILMLDSFDSIDPSEYSGGFPLHPHRGIETISLIASGKMMHRDSLGNEDIIGDGEVQWMTAGSGILHEEKLPKSNRLLGVQLWLNLPRKDKMTTPAYYSIKRKDIKEIDINGGTLRLISGNYKDHEGFLSNYLPLDYYHIVLEPNKEITLNTESDKSVMLFLLEGNAEIANEMVEEKTALKLTEGNYVKVKSLDEKLQILFISSKKLNESISWGGPIVMNSKEELELAFNELREGTFLKQEMKY
jgi:redox-sensitive bicupin YhaK (pirin superfamily)